MTSTSTAAFTHTVDVGKADYSISPDVVLAEVGDFIRYNFYPKNHSIVRAEYGYPCVPYELLNTRPGFFSGFRPVDTVLNNPPSFIVRVNDTDPIFVYCSSPEACDEYGMVAVVNPNATTSLERHRQLAMESSFVLQPGDDWPTEGESAHEDSTSSSSSSSSTSTITTSSTSSFPSSPVVTTPTATSSTVAAAISQTSHGLAPGAIAGIAIGASAILLLAAIAVWICGRRSNGHRRNDGSGKLYFGGKKDRFSGAFRSGTATPATMPPDYNHHGVPIMTQNKAYPNGMTSTNVVEHYIPSTGSPPPPVSPHYVQQNYPPHVLDPAAFQHPGFAPQNMPMGQVYAPTIPQQQYAMPNQAGFQQLRSEIYSGTPAPQQASSMSYGLSGSGNSAAAPVFTRNSLSMSGNSRGGSPDPTAEMNASWSQAGTLNQAGGGVLQQPMPVRNGGAFENEDKKYD